MRLRRKLSIAAATLTMGTALAIAPMSPASADWWPDCYGYTDGGRGLEWVCQNGYQAPVYNVPGGYVIGNIPPTWQETAMWCRADVGPWVGGPHAWRWVFSYEAGGWLRDTDIGSETDSIGRICPAAI